MGRISQANRKEAAVPLIGSAAQVVAHHQALDSKEETAAPPFAAAIAFCPCDATRSWDHRYNGGRRSQCRLWHWHLASWDVSPDEAHLFAVPLGSDVHWHPCRTFPAP